MKCPDQQLKFESERIKVDCCCCRLIRIEQIFKRREKAARHDERRRRQVALIPFCPFTYYMCHCKEVPGSVPPLYFAFRGSQDEDQPKASLVFEFQASPQYRAWNSVQDF